jgi:hypothetical protein
MRSLIDLLRTGRTRPVLAAAAGTVALGTGLTIGVLTAQSPSHAATTADAVPAASQSSPTTSPSSPTSTPAGASKGARHDRHVVRGTITAISGQTWTVRTPRGRTVTVDITSDTKIGPRLRAAGPVVGTDVVIQFSGQVSGQSSTVTAVRAGLARHLQSGGGSSTSPTTAPATTAPPTSLG